MKKPLVRRIILMLIIFVFIVSFKTQSYFNTINASDSAFSQSISQFINDWYDKTENDLKISQQNKYNNEKNTATHISQEEDKEKYDEFENLVVPEFTSGLQAFTFANYVLTIANGISIEGSGAIKAAGIDQTLRSINQRDNNGNLYSFNASYSSMKKIGFEMYYNKRMLKFRKSSDITPNLTAKFQDHAWQFSSPSTYAITFGCMPDELAYIVDETTVLSEENFTFSDNIYTFSLNLHPVKSTPKVRQQVKVKSDSSKEPIFKSVKLNVKINSDGKFLSIEYIENYKVFSIIEAEVFSHITDVFSVVHGEVKIPVPSGF